MQRFAQSWLVFELTGSATIVGLVVGLQALPMLVMGPYAGVIADRMDRRRLMIGLQTVMCLLAVILGLLVLTHTVRLWEIFVLAGLLGVNDCFENPARQAFVFEAVGPDRVRNAASLNTVLTNIARATGPALGALVVGTIGIGACFLINAASFVAVILSLVFLDRAMLRVAPPVARAHGQLRQGISYVRKDPDLWVPIVMMALIGTFAWEFQVSLPPMAKVFHSGATGYGLMNSVQGLGAIVGGLVSAKLGRVGIRFLGTTAGAFGLTMILAAIAPNLYLELICMALVGAVGVTFVGGGNGSLQVSTLPAMRGRVMSLWAVAFQGSTPVGGPIAGYVANAFGARAALGMGAVSCLGAALVGAGSRRRGRP